MREKWIDFLKAVATIAVVQNHLPRAIRLNATTYIIFSVSLFILLGGGTAAISLEHEISLDYKSYVLKKMKRILLPYVIATCGYVLFENGKLDFSYLMVKILTFSEGSLGHMYYLVFYLELTLIAPVLVRIYKVCEKNEFMQMVLLVCSLILSYLFTNYTYCDKFLSAGRYLFGGNYFFLFNLGIYLYFHIRILEKIRAKIIGILLSLVMLGYMVYKQWCLEWWSNPPNEKVMIYTVVIYILGYSSFTLMQKIFEGKRIMVWADRVLNPFILIGRYSFYVYLWHMIIIDMFGARGMYDKGSIGIIEKLIINGFILFLPCLDCIVYEEIKKVFLKYFGFKKQNLEKC